MGDYRPHTPKWFGPRRAAQVVAFFALKSGGKINVLMASKLAYLADRLSLETRDHSITGDNYVSMEFGPVCSNTYDYMNGRGSTKRRDWSAFIEKRRNYDLPLAAGVTLDSLDELSRSDLKILEKTWKDFHDIDKYELAEWTHKFCPEWQDPGKSSKPIEFSRVFKKLKKDDPDSLIEDINLERRVKLDVFSR
jgi:hypothetical protein